MTASVGRLAVEPFNFGTKARRVLHDDSGSDRAGAGRRDGAVRSESIAGPPAEGVADRSRSRTPHASVRLATAPALDRARRSRIQAEPEAEDGRSPLAHARIKYIKYLCKVLFMATTVRVEKRVVEELKGIKRKLGFRALGDVVEFLVREYKASKLERLFGVDKGRISGFREEDRLEDRR